MNWQDAPAHLLLGHRGASAAAPENTIKAFDLAVAQGASGFEFDVQLAADGVPVIIHDWTVERTTNGQGTVTELSSQALQALDAGSGEPVPTLADLFSRYEQTVLYNLELKDRHRVGRGLERAVAEQIERFGVAHNVLVSSFNPYALRRMRRYVSSATILALLVAPRLAILPRAVFRGGAEHPHHSLITGRYMAAMQKRGMWVNTWTVDDPALASTLFEMGVRAIITNDPARLLSSIPRPT